DFANPGTDDKVIKYTPDGTGPDNWVITVDFSKDPEKDAIRTALMKIKGYGKYYKTTTTTTGTGADATTTTTTEATALFDTTKTADTDYQFKVTLTTGKIEPVS
ncbi:MAG: hypothetical protein IJU26_09270, partial [Synergistaceae bacterium]|nr:hypothetical protein [Synergistaceae bacterium]